MTLAAYSHALAALAYSRFAVSLLRGGLAQRNHIAAQLSFGAAIAISAAWALASLAAQLTGSVPLAAGGAMLDLERYVAWSAFASLLLCPAGPQGLRFAVSIGLGAARSAAEPSCSTSNCAPA